MQLFSINYIVQFIIDKKSYKLGVDQARREKEMERLNESYASTIKEKSDLRACLDHLVSTESYRMLNGWSYSLSPECLRNGGRLEMPELTDVIFISYILFILSFVQIIAISLFLLI